MAESLLEMFLSRSARVVYGIEVNLDGWLGSTEEEFNFFLYSHPAKDSFILDRTSFYEIPAPTNQKILVTHKTYSFCKGSVFIRAIALRSASSPDEVAYFIKYCS